MYFDPEFKISRQLDIFLTINYFDRHFLTFDFITHVFMYFISAVYGMLNIDKLFYIDSSFNSKWVH